MSRQTWFQGTTTERNLVEGAAIMEPLSKRTGDPQAKDYDEACEIFKNAVSLARAGDLQAACPQIACAYLLDGRSINFCLKPPETSTEEAFVDYALLVKMVQRDPKCFGAMVIVIMLGQFLGPNPKLGQGMIAQALQCIDHLLEIIEEQPSIERQENGILGGCLKRTELLRQRSTFHMAMGNRKQAMKDLTKALKIDENCTTAREARACVWASTDLKDDSTIHNEFKRVLSEHHEDDRGNEVAYAWLAITTLRNPNLGSMEDAKGYYERCLEAKNRRDQLYGKRSKEEESPALQHLRELFEVRLRQHPEAEIFRRDLDNVERGFANVRIPQSCSVEARKRKAPKNKYACVKCGVSQETNGGKLMKCSRCNLASYCSKDCQKKDWKSHKAFCKMKDPFLNPSASTQSEPTNNAPPEKKIEDIIAKEPIGNMTGNSTAAKRMESELCQLYQKYGAGLSSWWHSMNMNDRKALLLDLTYNTLPLSLPSHDEIRRTLLDSAGISHALFEYNLKGLVGQCECHGNCSHYHNDLILHEISEWAQSPERKAEEEWKICDNMYSLQIYPDMFAGTTAIVLPKEGDLVGEPLVFTDKAPDDVIQQYKDYVKNGVVHDASIATFMIGRKVLALTLLVKLFDEYQFKVRRQPAVNPMERLLGCSNCKRPCQDAASKRCTTCKISWFCCLGCMIANGHKICPYEQECDSKAIFH